MEVSAQELPDTRSTSARIGIAATIFVGDGSGAREVKRLAKVTQLDSGYPWMGSPKADPQVRIS